MKLFMKEYIELWKQSWQFTKNHWLGLVILELVLMLAWSIYYGVVFGLWVFDWMETVYDKICSFFGKNN